MKKCVTESAGKKGKMGVTRAGLAVVMLALLVGAQHVDEEELQSLDGSLAKNDFSDDDAELINVTRKVILTQETGLKEFEDHAEVKLQTTVSPAIQEETMTSPFKETTEGVEQETLASEVPETLPTPLPNKTEGTSAETITESHLSDLPWNDKNSSDVLKEVTTKKSSVVPKKGVKYEKQTVVPKKGADPISLTPSVVARKGVGAGELQSSVSAQKEAYPKKIEESKGKTIAYFDEKEMNKNINSVPVPQPVVPTSVQRNSTYMSTNATNLLSNSSLPAVTADSPDNHSTQSTLLYTAAHFKPTAATDDVAGSESKGWSYGGAIVGAAVLIALVVAVVIGYRKVQDFKMRRQYARVDYLIEGMYDV